MVTGGNQVLLCFNLSHSCKDLSNTMSFCYGFHAAL